MTLVVIVETGDRITADETRISRWDCFGRHVDTVLLMLQSVGIIQQSILSSLLLTLV